MKYIPFEKVAGIYNRISAHVPNNKVIKTAQDYALMVLNEVMDNQMEQDDYQVYLKVQHDFLLEDARNFVADALANHNDCDVEDITDEELDGYDYEYLVQEYVDRQDCNVAFNDTWQYVVEEYLFG